MAKTREQLTTVYRAAQEQTTVLTNALIDFANNKDQFTPGVVRELIKNRPVTMEKLERISALNDEIVSKYGEQIIKLFQDVKDQFEQLKASDENFSDKVEWIDYDSRYVIENISLRNIRVAEDNPQLNIKANENVANIKKTDIEKILTSIFEERESEEYEGHRLPLTKELDELYERQEDYKSQWARNNTYISVGKVKGKFVSKEKSLEVEAPLLFIPVEIVYNEDEVIVYYDDTRRIKYNKDIFVAKSNIAKENLFLIENAYANLLVEEKVNVKQFMSHLEELLEDNGIAVSKTANKGSLVISDELLIGQFDVYKNATHRDVEFMLENGIATKNVLDMISSEDVDYDTEEDMERMKEVNSSKLPYFITKLNYPQTRAVKAVDAYNDVLIQGPPGTGKTETITSIVANAIMQEKNILISSEKAVAIEVIKNRLQDLAVYSVLLTNIEDTQTFYKQIEIMVEEAQKAKQNEEVGGMENTEREDFREWNSLKAEIFDYVKQYKEIFDHLNSSRLGKPFSWIYKNHASHRTTEPEIKEILNDSTILEVIKSHKMLNKNLHKVLFMLNRKFSYKKNVDEFDVDKAVIHKYPFLVTHTKSHVTAKRLQRAMNALENETDESLFEHDSFSKKAISILRPIFEDPKHLFSYIHSKAEIESVINIVSIKLGSVEPVIAKDEEEANSERAKKIYSAIGSAWMVTFDRIVEEIQRKGKKVDQELVSNLIFDHTMMAAVSHIEQSNPKLQENISNGNIDTFNQMISRALTEMIESTLSLSDRVLRDSLLNALDANAGKQQILNFIQTSKSANINKFMERYWDIVFNSVKIWMLPANEVASFFPLEPELFDVVVIDEASQMTLDKALPLMYRAKQLVISGDDKQLKPSVNMDNRIYNSAEENELEGMQIPTIGLQDALKNKLPNFLLNYHYRAKFAELISYSNTNIYNKTLYVSTPNTFKADDTPIEHVMVKAARMVNGKNEKEATQVVKEVQSVLTRNEEAGIAFDAKTIGIIAFTHEQREAVNAKLQEARKKDDLLDKFMTRKENKSRNGEDETLFVKNVSEVQGDERDVVIFSIGFAKQSNGKMPTDFGSISREFGENRLNVVVTRAKSKIIVVNSFEPRDFADIIPETDIGGKQLLNFIDYAIAVSENDMQSVNTILENKTSGEIKSLESRMHEEIYHLIKDAGYYVDYQYGFDNYKIDFVVREFEGGPIKVAFNIDNEQYLKHRQTFEREFYLPTYLAARGWNLHRVWSHQWSKDVEEQNDRIIDLIEKAMSKDGGKEDVISTFGKGTTVLDFDSLKDGEFLEVSEDNVIIEEGEELIDTRYRDLKALTKELKSAKHQKEEDRWLAEMDAIENKSRNLNSDIDGLVKKDFNEAPVEKLLDGIESDDLDAIIALLDKRLDK